MALVTSKNQMHGVVRPLVYTDLRLHAPLWKERTRRINQSFDDSQGLPSHKNVYTYMFQAMYNKPIVVQWLSAQLKYKDEWWPDFVQV